MQKIHRELARKYAFDSRDEPLLHVSRGEPFEIETYDASTGFFKTTEDKAIPARRPGYDRQPPLVNPIGGPVYLEGAERGDILIITIDDILVDDYSWTAIGPKRGPLGESTRWPEISGQYTTKIFHHTPGPSGTTRDGTMQFNDRISWPISPFIGTLGMAPDRESCSSLDGQGPWGGNLDIRDIVPGNRILLPIFHTGGALFTWGTYMPARGIPSSAAPRRRRSRPSASGSISSSKRSSPGCVSRSRNRSYRSMPRGLWNRQSKPQR